MRDAVEQARAAVAQLVGARPSEVVFTASGTESINLASRAALRSPGRPSICAAVEHAAVRRSAARYGPVAEPVVDQVGRVDLDHLDMLLRGPGDGERPSMVHCQLANHEVGTIQPVAEVAARSRSAGALTHVDACSAVGRIPVDFSALGADLLSLSSHKLGGPPGVGALVVRRGLRVDPLVVGGDQERGRHAGMENVVGILGFGAVAGALARPGAIELEARRARARTDRLICAALAVEGVVTYGDPTLGLPHLVCLGVGGVEAEGVVLGLDQVGIAVHSGSACSSEALEPSPVLLAMGVDAERSLRLSVGWNTGDDDVDAFGHHFPPVVAALRELRG